jgi:hypothetical protein
MLFQLMLKLADKDDNVSQLFDGLYFPFSLVWMFFSTAAILNACKSVEKSGVGNKVIIDIAKDCKKRDANLPVEFADVP